MPPDAMSKATMPQQFMSAMRQQMHKPWLPWLGAGLLLVLLLLCLFQVDETEYAVVARFGAPQRTIATAGLHWKWPAPIETVIPVDRRTHVLNPEPNEYLTSDKKNVIVDSFLVWAVDDPVQYLISIRDRSGAEARLSDVLRAVVGEALGAHSFSALVSHEPQPTRLTDVVDNITQLANARAQTEFGVQVALVRIKRLNFPVQNRRAVFRRMEAERRSIAAGFRAEGSEQFERIRAEADRQRAQLLAEAERQARALRGEAEAEAARIYAQAYGADPAFYDFLRSLQALEAILSENTTLVIPNDHELLNVLNGAAAAPMAGE